MKILEGREWPAALREELEREVAAIPAKEMMEGVVCPSICPPGFRKDSRNVPIYRRNLVAALLRPEVPGDALDFFRRHSFYQEFVCVLSTVALTVGFADMAAFTGGAKLVLGMLLDLRDPVRRRALAHVDSGAPYVPVPADPEAARAELAKTFEPFVKAFSTVAVAQNVTVVNREEGDRRLIASLQDDLRNSREARSAAENAARDSERRVAAAERRVQRLEAEIGALQSRISEAEAARDEARKALADRERTLSAAQVEIVRQKTQIADFAGLREECFQRRSRMAELEREKRSLLEVQSVLAERVAALEKQADASAEAALRDDIDRPQPLASASAKSLRERLAEAACSEAPAGTGRLRILVDGHNVIHLAPPFADRIGIDAHESIRDALVARIVRAQPLFGNCETEIYFDGSIRNDYNPARGVRVHFSGGEGDHRADRAILDVLEFYLDSGDYCVVVTEDGDFRTEAMLLGSRVVGSRDFVELLP